MKAEELKTKTVDELNKILLDLRKEQLNLRFQKSGGSLENVALMRKARRNVARVKTFLTQKRLEEAAASSKKAA